MVPSALLGMKSERERELISGPGGQECVNMKRKWLRMAASALALTGVALAGCGQQGGRQLEYPSFQPTQATQPDGAATAASTQQAALAGTAALESVQAPGISVTATEATTTLTPRVQLGKLDTSQVSKEVAEKAKADLAEKLGIPASEITVVLVIHQEFTPDGFYCRTNKGRTSQEEPTVVISGETILLEAQGSRYEYHAADQLATFCRQLQ